MSVDKANYIREWRKTEAGQRSLDLQRKRDRARSEAYKKLAELHPSEFEVLFDGALRAQD